MASDAPAPGATGRPRLAVYKLASCDGCQLTLLDCEDELLDIADRVHVAHFTEMTSLSDTSEPFDVTLVEGSVTTAEQREHVRHIRASTKLLVTIGACATAGGVQALRNWRDASEMLRVVYARPEYIDALATSTPISDHVKVDFELRGCPIDKRQLLELLTALLTGRKPAIRDESVCMECKRAGNVCVMVARDEPCLGPITHAGCGALCPSYDRGCYGCFGPHEAANARALGTWLREAGAPAAEVKRRLRLFTGWSPAFREESARHDEG